MRTFDAQIREQLQAYLTQSGETIEEIAFTGPSMLPTGHPNRAVFNLLCAYRMVETDPTNDFNYLHLASALLRSGSSADAIAVYKYLDSLNPHFMGYYDDPQFNIGIVESDAGHFCEAIQAFQIAISRFRESEQEMSYYLGTAFHGKGEFEAAVLQYTKCMQSFRNPQSESRTKVESMLDLAKRHLPFPGKRKSPWLENIH